MAAALLMAACGDDGGSPDNAAEPAEEVEDVEASLTDQGGALDVVFEDDFADDAGDWGEGEYDGSVLEFTDGGYQVALRDGREEVWNYGATGLVEVEDSSTTIEVEEVDGAADRSYGAMCRLSRTGPSDHYTLLVNGGAGSFTIARWHLGVPEILAEGDDEALQGLGESGPVEVTATCFGEGGGELVELAVAVDGEEVGAATDEDGLGAGISGIALAAFGSDDAEEPVRFTGIEIRGDATDGSVELEDDFSDPDSGFAELVDEEDGNFITYGDSALVFDLRGNASTGVPVRTPVPLSGEITATIDGDLGEGYAAFCINGDGGQYEFSITDGGYASVGFYTEDGDFTVLDEAFDAYRSTGEHRITGTWVSDGSSTDLHLAVDGEVIVSASGDERLGQMVNLQLCGTVALAAGDGAHITYAYRDLVVTGAD